MPQQEGHPGTWEFLQRQRILINLDSSVIKFIMIYVNFAYYFVKHHSMLSESESVSHSVISDSLLPHGQ